MCVVSHALNTIQHTLISTLSSITLDEVNQNIVTKYRLNDLNQWVLTNSKHCNTSLQDVLLQTTRRLLFISILTKYKSF